jgi:hypothetical protein
MSAGWAQVRGRSKSRYELGFFSAALLFCGHCEAASISFIGGRSPGCFPR